jgi:hypothetical protein
MSWPIIPGSPSLTPIEWQGKFHLEERKIDGELAFWCAEHKSWYGLKSKSFHFRICAHKGDKRDARGVLIDDRGSD